jgi:hypothetical protein
MLLYYGCFKLQKGDFQKVPSGNQKVGYRTVCLKYEFLVCKTKPILQRGNDKCSVKPWDPTARDSLFLFF